MNNRPIYETTEHLQIEREFLEAIEQRFKCKYIKLPHTWQFDCFLVRGNELSSFGEVKRRNHNHDTHPTVFISNHKAERVFYFQSLLSNSRNGIPFVYFVRFDNGDYYCKVTPEEFYKWEKVLLTASNHADDPLDTEYVRCIPIENFKKF